MKAIYLTIFVLLVFASQAFADRVVRFNVPTNARCPNDRVAGVVTIQNIGDVPIEVRLQGGFQIGVVGNGSCSVSYASLGITAGQVFNWVFLEVDDGNATPVAGFYKINSGGKAAFMAGGSYGGGVGFVFGTITVKGDLGSATAAGLIHVVQDSASPNLIVNHGFDIWRGEAF